MSDAFSISDIESLAAMIRTMPLYRTQRKMLREAVRNAPTRRGRKPQEMCAAGLHVMAVSRRKGRGGCGDCNNANSKLRRVYGTLKNIP